MQKLSNVLRIYFIGRFLCASVWCVCGWVRQCAAEDVCGCVLRVREAEALLLIPLRTAEMYFCIV